jgi:hypothetical protein
MFVDIWDLDKSFWEYINRKLFAVCSKNLLLHVVMLSFFYPTHCKDKIPKFWNKYSQKRNIGVSFPISTFMRL